MQYSSYQKNIFGFIEKQKDNLVVIARAGCGKTFTAIESIKFLPKDKKILMCAFNKDIVLELKKRVPKNVNVSTIHSIGFKAILTRFGKVNLDTNKVPLILESLLDKQNYDSIPEFVRLISLCKATLQDTESDLSSMIEKYDIDVAPFSENEFIKIALKALFKSKEDKKNIDYDDMIYFPFVYNLNLEKWDYIYVDEAQDLNYAQLVMILSSISKTSRVFMFLDDRQVLYGWRGADSSLLNKIIEKLQAKKLPLSMSYRCPHKVVSFVNHIVPDFEGHHLNYDGTISSILLSDLGSNVKKGDFVLSRTNAPLIKMYKELIKYKIPVTIQGKDIGVNLAMFIKKTKKKTIPSLLEHLEKWKNKEIGKLKRERKDFSHIIDKYECICALAESCSSIPDLLKTITKLFSDVDDKDKVVLGTVHSVKGLERERVFLLTSSFRRGSEAEDNIWYVACTRTKKNLFLVKNKDKEEDTPPDVKDIAYE